MGPSSGIANFIYSSFLWFWDPNMRGVLVNCSCSNLDESIVEFEQSGALTHCAKAHCSVHEVSVSKLDFVHPGARE